MALVTVLTPETMDTSSASNVGGKAMGLYWLAQYGVRVPKWFVIPSSWFRLHLTQHELVSGEITAELQNRIKQTCLSAEHIQRLAEALETLGTGPYAVRSSMIGEDSATHSYAGQLESYLFENTVEGVAKRIIDCWASAFSQRVLDYRQRAEGRITLPHMGVIVQQMVNSDVSGVLFTAHPTTGQRHHALLTAAYGQGEGIVSGLCNTDEIVWHHRGYELSSTIAKKDVQIVHDADTRQGTKEIAVPSELQQKRSVTHDDVRALCSRAVELANQFGTPLDIEWSKQGDTLYFLQARPITNLPQAENTDGPTVVFDNSNIQESYCGVTTPLTFSFASRAYASVYEQTMRAIGISDDVITKHQSVLRNLLGLVNGRVYYNINNWYRGLSLLPSFGRNKSDMENMMGLTDPVDFVLSEKLSIWKKTTRLPQMLKAGVQLKTQFRALKKSVPLFLENFEKNYKLVQRDSFDELTFSELMEKLEFLRTHFLERWHVPIVNDFYVMTSMGNLKRLVNDNVQLSALMGGEEGIESTEPTHLLMGLAKMIRTQPRLFGLFQTHDTQAILQAIGREHAGIAEQLRAYIDRYGDRCMGELKLETISLREDPRFIIDVLRNYVAMPHLEPNLLLEREQERRQQAEKQLFESLKSGERKNLKKILEAARTSVKNRENMRLARTRVFGIYRDAYTAIGKRLVEAGKLEKTRDVFYLTVEEIEAYFDGRSVNANLGAVAIARKAEFATYETRDLPHHFSTRGPVYHGNRYTPPQRVVSTDDPHILKGIGCYPGIVSAQARVILKPQEASTVAGKILVTVRTDPGWAPLFPSCKGILVERGSTLSHSAVVARELGIPAIVGIPDLMARVHDGDHLLMDGAAGTVQI